MSWYTNVWWYSDEESVLKTISSSCLSFGLTKFSYNCVLWVDHFPANRWYFYGYELLPTSCVVVLYSQAKVIKTVLSIGRKHFVSHSKSFYFVCLRIIDEGQHQKCAYGPNCWFNPILNCVCILEEVCFSISTTL